MTWLTLRQLRVQVLGVLAILVVGTGVLLIAGRPEVFGSVAPSDSALYFAGLVAVFVLPGLLGLFWGAPLVTRELEAGTHRLVWNQSVTRSRWLATKLAVTGLTVTAVAGLASLIVSWWATPIDNATRSTGITDHAENISSRLSPLVFGARGIVPMGYALFAFLLGVAVGIVLRRTVLAMAVTLVLYVAVQVGWAAVVRPMLPAPVEQTVVMTKENVNQIGLSDDRVATLGVAGPNGSWVVANDTVDASGAVSTPPASFVKCINPDTTVLPDPATWDQCFTALADAGYRQRIAYQPGDRFWTIQFVETGLYLVLGALLATAAFVGVRRLS